MPDARKLSVTQNSLEFQDVTRCDSYTLSFLLEGNFAVNKTQGPAQNPHLSFSFAQVAFIPIESQNQILYFHLFSFKFNVVNMFLLAELRPLV